MSIQNNTVKKAATAAIAIADCAVDTIGATAHVIGGTAKLAGTTAQSLAPAGAALGELTTQAFNLTATTVGAANDLGLASRRIARAPLDVVASATELACTPLVRALKTATMAINAGFDKIDSKIPRTAKLAL